MLYWHCKNDVPAFDQQHVAHHRRVLAANANGAYCTIWQDRMTGLYHLNIEGSWVDLPRPELSRAIAYAEDHARHMALDSAYVKAQRPD